MYEPRPKHGTPLDSAINEMDLLSARHPDETAVIDAVKHELEELRTRFNHDELDEYEVSELIFQLYWLHRKRLQQTSAGHIMRVLGDDFGTLEGVDLEILEEYFEAARNDITPLTEG